MVVVMMADWLNGGGELQEALSSGLAGSVAEELFEQLSYKRRVHLVRCTAYAPRDNKMLKA
jgi:hypothetical protein